MKQQISPALMEFINNVMKDLIDKDWTIRDDCCGGMPEDILDNELAQAIIKYAGSIELDSWKQKRIEQLQQELKLLTEN